MTPVTTNTAASGRVSSGHAASTVEAVAGKRPGISLAEVNSAAALQRRVDRTYLVTTDQMRNLGAALGSRFRSLEIEGQRLMRYDSVYFDSPSLTLFRAHSHGRRRRFKVRVRTYLDSGARFVEVKTKSGRGETVKHRIPYLTGERTVLDGEALDFVSSVLRQEYDVEPPPLVPVLVSRYRRTTLVDPAGGARLTCDVDMRWSTSRRTVEGPEKVLLESKTTGKGQVDRELAMRGIRPISMSKYALGTALLHPGLAANRWNRLLRTEFDWRRDASDGLSPH